MTEVGTSGVMSVAVSAGSTVREAGKAQDHSPPRPKPSRREATLSLFLAALNFLLSVIDWRSPSSRSALALTSRPVRYGTTGESGFEECDGGWNATAGRTNAFPITTNDALSTPRTQSRVKSGSGGMSWLGAFSPAAVLGLECSCAGRE